MKVGGKIPNEETFYERSLITFVGLRSVPVEPKTLCSKEDYLTVCKPCSASCHANSRFMI